MAITGRFEGDFSKFVDACNKAELKLRDFEAGAGKVGVALNKMGDSFSGVKLIQDANLLTKAIGDLGGATTLTAKEQAKVNAQVSEAIAKYAALGQKAPQDMLDLAAATKKVQEQTGGLTTSMIAFGAAIGTFAGNLATDAFKKIGSAIAAIPGEIIALGERGATINDVADAFANLSGQIGLTSKALISDLRAGTRGTIDDFSLMQTTNKLLSDGFKGTEADFKTLAQGAALLADTTGGDTKEAFDALSEAMETGKSKGLNLLGVHINADEALQRYANTIHKSVKDLTDQEKIQATATETLRQLRDRLKEAGDVQLDFGDRVAQAQTIFTNFTNELSRAIANSPVLESAMTDIGKALKDTFGEHQADTIKTIVGWIDKAAIASVYFAKDAVVSVGEVAKAWYGLSVAVLGTMSAISNAVLLVYEASTRLQELKASVDPWSDTQQKLAQGLRAQTESLRTFTQGLNNQTKEALAGAAGHNALSEAAGKLDAMLDKLLADMKAAAQQHADTAGAVDEHTKALGRHGGAYHIITPEEQKHLDLLKEIAAAQVPLNAAQILGAEYLLSLGLSHEKVAFQMGLATIQIDRLVDSTKTWAEIVKSMPGSVYGLSGVIGIQMVDAFKRGSESLLGLSAVMSAQIPLIDNSKAKLKAYLDDFKRGLDETDKRIQAAKKAHEDFIKSIDQLASSLAQLAQIAGGAFGSIVQDLSVFVSSMNVANKANDAMAAGWAELHKEGGNLTEGFSQIAAGAASMAAGFLQATAAGSTLDRTLKGAAFGAQAGAAFGPWGAAIGAAAGGLVGFIRGLSAGRDAVKDFAASFGGFDALHAKLNILGAAGEQLWIKLTQGVGRNNPAEAKKAIDAINAALAGQDAWMQRLPGLIEKYGLSWEEAGNKAKQAHLDEIAQGLIQDFADLSKAGFDVSLITEKMSTAITDYYRLAIKTGTEIPIAMKPLLQKMVELGTLTDDAGNKIEGLDDVHWAITLTDGFKGVIDAIHELTDALTKGVKPALEEIGRTVVHPTIRPRYDTSEIPTGDEVPGFARGGVVLPFASGGFVPRGTDTVPAMLTPGEMVLTKSQQRNLGGVTIGSINITATGNYADTPSARRELARFVAEEIMRQQRLVTRLNVA